MKKTALSFLRTLYVAAPKGCLQYYKGISGTVESFNFQGNMTTYEGTPQIAELKYAACVEKVDGYCGIAWERNTAVGDMSFTVSGNANTLSPGLIGTLDASATGTADCIDDYVIIPGGVVSSGIIADRYCGLGFPIRVYSTHQPFTLYTVTDDNEMPDSAGTTGTNGGFSLNYQQITC
ncbi:hypothetical protein SK128_005693 [Halocaridina rubra]|uniref:CUB domain-containing protein n=1 Tax=Halocaridina rubra TaxID=373956 RepID=A0AAN9A3T7_HALRR